MSVDPRAILMFRGDTYPLEFLLSHVETGVSLDLTDATLTLTVTSVKDPPDNTTKVFALTGEIDPDPTLGKVVFRPSAVDTGVIGKYFYDIQMDIGLDIRTVAKSTFTIVQDNTKTVTS